MNDDLKYTFNNINDWLKFAEAKNVGLLAMNATIVIGILQGDSTFSSSMKFFEGFMIILFCISSCISLYTVLPVLNNWFKLYKKLNQNEFNLQKNSLNALFFGDITKLSSDQFIELFEYKHNITLSLAEKDFANQITINSEICWQKYKLFSFAASISFSAFVITILLVIITAFP